MIHDSGNHQEITFNAITQNSSRQPYTWVFTMGLLTLEEGDSEGLWKNQELKVLEKLIL